MIYRKYFWKINCWSEVKIKSAPFIEEFLDNFRSVVPFIKKDRILSDDIHKAKNFLKEIEIDANLLY